MNEGITHSIKPMSDLRRNERRNNTIKPMSDLMRNERRNERLQDRNEEMIGLTDEANDIESAQIRRKPNCKFNKQTNK